MLPFLFSSLITLGVKAAPVPDANPQLPGAAGGLPGGLGGGLAGGLPGGLGGGLGGGPIPTNLPFPIPSSISPGGGLPFPIPTGGFPFPIPTGGSGGFGGLGGGLGGGASSGSGLGGLLGGLGGGSSTGGGFPGGLGGGFGGIPKGGAATPPGTPSTGSGGGFSIPSLGGFGGASTSNDLTSGQCKQLTYIFARGTTEPGNMGSTVGPAFASQLKQRFGADNVAVQGVDYPADFAGTITGSVTPGQAQGATKMTQLAKQAASQCPDSKILLAGYSQGAQQVHGALQDLGAGNTVAAAVTFGDPLSAQPFQNIDQAKTKVFCAQGDTICQDAFVITPAHLSYATDSVGPAADFVKGVVVVVGGGGGTGAS